MISGALLGCAAFCTLEVDPSASAAEVVITAETANMCLLPAEWVLLTGTAEEPEEEEPVAPMRATCPEEMAQIGRYCVDRWEAHLIRRDAKGIEHTHPFNMRVERGVKYEARSAPGVHPQAYISRLEARAACEAADKRLCSLREWRRACQGPEAKTYPYGEKEKRGVCNNGKAHLLAKVFGNNPRNWTPQAFNSPDLYETPGYIALTGAHERCISDDGVYDLVGNLHEWVSDTASAEMMDEINGEGVYRRKQPWKATNGMFLGGFFNTRNEHGPGCHFTTVAHSKRYHDYSMGFRCCADAHDSRD